MCSLVGPAATFTSSEWGGVHNEGLRMKCSLASYIQSFGICSVAYLFDCALLQVLLAPTLHNGQLEPTDGVLQNVDLEPENEDDDEDEAEEGHEKFEPEDGDKKFEPEDGDKKFEPEGEDDEKFEPEDAENKFEPEGEDDEKFEPEDAENKFEPEEEDDEKLEPIDDEKFEPEDEDDNFEPKKKKQKVGTSKSSGGNSQGDFPIFKHFQIFRWQFHFQIFRWQFQGQGDFQIFRWQFQGLWLLQAFTLWTSSNFEEDEGCHEAETGLPCCMVR